MPKLRMFLSHISAEAKLADFFQNRIAHDFIGLVHVFVSSDRTSIPVGSKWLEEVTTALKDADLHVVLSSCDSVKRPWVNFEAGAAHIRGIPIIPLCHSGLTPGQLPVPLSEYEGLVAADEEALKSFYQGIAVALESDLPSVDFASYAKDIAVFEAEYGKRCSDLDRAASLGTDVEIVRNPRVLCISSEQFLKLGFENQLQKVIDAFPSNVAHNRVISSSDVREALTLNKFDIVHIAAFVCPRSGDIYFSDIDLNTGRPSTEPEDLLTADAFAALLQISKTRLVVIASCDSVALAATLLTSSHVVATRDMVSAKMMAVWVDAFYSMLSIQPLSQALEYAIKASGAPMRLYARQPKSPNLTIEMTKVKAAS